MLLKVELPCSFQSVCSLLSMPKHFLTFDSLQPKDKEVSESDSLEMVKLPERRC